MRDHSCLFSTSNYATKISKAASVKGKTGVRVGFESKAARISSGPRGISEVRAIYYVK